MYLRSAFSFAGSPEAMASAAGFTAAASGESVGVDTFVGAAGVVGVPMGAVACAGVFVAAGDGVVEPSSPHAATANARSASIARTASAGSRRHHIGD